MELPELDGFFIRIVKTQRALQLLRSLELSNNGYKPKRSGDSVAIPLVEKPSTQVSKILKEALGDFEIRQTSFEASRTKPRSLRDVARDRLPAELIAQLPHSIDSIGDIAIIELTPALQPYAAQIGQALIEINPHVRLVLRKSGDVGGTFRTRDLQIVAGRGGTQTIHQEFSCRYSVDVSTVYFNPRLGNERRRVAGKVMPGETIVDMFAGVGPYSILIAKLQPQSTVYAVDINPSAVKYLKENILSNGLADRVVPILGNARDLSQTKIHNLADRVIMNLPSESEQYLDAALQVLKPDGGVVHFYQFAPRGLSLNYVKQRFRASVLDLGRRVQSINYCKVIREIAPTKVQIGLDAAIV